MNNKALLALIIFSITNILDASPLPIPEINYEKFTLNNGLTVVVHEDRKVPMVAVNIWYHVGSKNENVGKTGFAHLFEHLMFNGTENYNNEYFEPFEKIGATDQNGTTSNDRTNYFQNVPTNALDLALWMESERMGHILGVIDQDKLDEQRGVVQNEKRQGENQPYGMAWNTIAKSAYPNGHPYSWSVIGSMDDLNAATMDDVNEWFKKYYGPNNAVLVLAGDINLETAKIKAEEYFGDIPSGPNLPKPKKWIAKRDESKRETIFDNVPQTRIMKVWNVPESGSKGKFCA
jgi:zinc protease